MRWNFILIVLLSLFLGACASKRQASRGKQDRPSWQTGRPDRQARNNPHPSRSLNTEEYIRLYSSMAVEEMQRSGVPASITLAQGILESGNGNSRLARQANNHFGIKCTPDWKGGRTYKDDDRRNDCFRVYASAKESFRDHSQFLKRQRYAFLFKLKITDYKGWARGLKRAGYATNPRYPQLLISLIERYELYYYDRPGSRKSEEVLARNEEPRGEAAEQPLDASTDPAADPPAAGKGPAARNDPPAGDTASVGEKNTADGSAAASGSAAADGSAAAETSTSHYYYTVKQGDTLFAISRRFDITVEELREWNDLSSNAISGGQRIRVSR